MSASRLNEPTIESLLEALRADEEMNKREIENIQKLRAELLGEEDRHS